MEKLVIQIPEGKSSLVKQLLTELGVTFKSGEASKSSPPQKTPNTVTAETIENAHSGIGLGEPITDIKAFMDSL